MKAFFKSIAIVSCIFVAATSANAQFYHYNGTCTQGAVKAQTSGLPSSNSLVSATPSCLVTVYITGTQNLATLYSNQGGGTPLSNPFTAQANALFSFYTSTGYYDIQNSGTGMQTTTLSNVGIGPVGGGGGGGGLNPGLQTQIVQYPTNGSTGGPTSITTDVATGKNLTVPRIFTGQITNGGLNSDTYASGSGNNGISNALSSTDCTTAGCFFGRPQTSSDNEVIQLALKGTYTHGQDNTYGTNQHFYYNAGLNSGVTFREANPASCFWNDSLVSQSNNENCRSIYSVIANPARYGQGFALGGPLNGHAEITNMFKYTRSIDVAHGMVFNCLAIGDCIARYTYLYPRGGTVQGADEGTKGDALHIIEPGSPAGFVTIGGANATLVTTNFAGNGGNQGDGYDLLDTPDIMSSGNLVSCSAGSGLLLNSCTTSDTHTVSTAYGVTTAACGTYAVRNAPVSSSCPINVTVGSFSAAANATVCIGDYRNPEQASITATGSGTITVGFAYTHPSGTPIYQGGLCGAKLTLGNGLTDPRVAPNYPMTTYFIAGSLSATSLDYVVQFNAGQNGKFQLAIPSMPTYNIVGTITRSANVVTVTNFAPSVMFPYNNYVAPGAATIVVSGATPSDLNGVVTGVKVTPTTISWNQTGANETGSGGTLSVTGLNNYFGYCGAETVFDPGVRLGATNNSTVPFQTGQLQLEPNNCNWTVGDEVIQPNFYSNTVIARDTVLSGFTPGLFGLPHIANSIDMSGSMYSGAQFNSVHDAESVSLFQGYGGTLLPHQYLNATDVETNIFTFKYPPINNGYLFSMNCPPEGCLPTSYNYNLFQLGSPTGASVFSYAPSSGFFYFSNPVIGSMWTAAETGIGVSVLGQAPGTDQVGGYFTPLGKAGFAGTNNALNFGNGAMADASGTLGMNNLVAPNVVAGINNPPTPVPLTFGSGGTTTYTYACVVRSANGTTAAASGTLTNGPATLSATNYNFPRCPVVPGGQSIDVYRTAGGATQGKIGTIANGDSLTLTPFKDTGLTADGTTPPNTNTTGLLTVYGPADGCATFSSHVLTSTGSPCSSGGSGSVTSVAQTVPSWLSVSGSPITSTGTLAITAATGQTANQFLATPNGSTGGVALRSIVAADVPTLNQNTSGTAANLSGTPALPFGTSATTASPGDNTTKLATDAFVLANALTGSGTTGYYGLWSGTTALGNGHIDDGVTTAGTITSTEPFVAPNVPLLNANNTFTGTTNTFQNVTVTQGTCFPACSANEEFQTTTLASVPQLYGFHGGVNSLRIASDGVIESGPSGGGGVGEIVIDPGIGIKGYSSVGGAAWEIISSSGTGQFSDLQILSKVTNAAGVQIATGSGCTITAGAIGNHCTATITMDVAEPDTAYKVTGCSVTNSTGDNLAVTGGINSISTTAFAIAEIAMSTVNTGGGTINCTVVHN